MSRNGEKVMKGHTLQREVSTSSTWDGGSVDSLDHSQHGAIVKMLESLIKSHVFFMSLHFCSTDYETDCGRYAN